MTEICNAIINQPLGRAEIEAVLPHRAPFLFLDRVLEYLPGRYAKAILDMRPDMDFFRGHFPGMPVMPGVLQIEAIAQAGAFTVLSLPRFAGKLALFAGARNARFRRPVYPGDQLEVEVEIEHLSSIGGKGKGVARVEGQVTCEVEILFSLTSPPQNTEQAGDTTCSNES